MRECGDAVTGLAYAQTPQTSPGDLKARLIAAATGRPAPRSSSRLRYFFAAAAAALFLALGLSLLGGGERIDLKGTPAAPAASGYALWKEEGSVELFVRGLPPPPAGKGYQLWHLKGGVAAPIPQAVFKPDASGILRGKDQLTQPIAKGDGFALTLEDEHGVKSPTMPIYLAP